MASYNLTYEERIKVPILLLFLAVPNLITLWKVIFMKKTEEYLKARINILKHRNRDNYRIIQKLQRELDKMSH